LPLCRKVKAVICPNPQTGLPQNIPFGAALGIAYNGQALVAGGRRAE